MQESERSRQHLGRTLAELLATYHDTGDERAMEQLVSRTRPKLLRVTRRICGDEDAEDCAQSAYHTLLRQGTVPPGGAVEGWLVTTAIRLAYRKRSLAQRQLVTANLLAVDGRSRTAEHSAEVREDRK